MGTCLSQFWRPRARRLAYVSSNITTIANTPTSSNHTEDAASVSSQTYFEPDSPLQVVEYLLLEDAATMPVHFLSRPGPPPSELGILEGFPPEVRLLIYEWIFCNSKPTVEVSVDYSRKGSCILSSQITHYGDELFHTSRTICEEAMTIYWPHVTTISASRPPLIPLSSPVMLIDDDEAALNPVDLDILVKALPKPARDNVLHLRNIRFTDIRSQNTMQDFEDFDSTSLLANFKKLQTVVFNEHHDGPDPRLPWNLKCRGVVLELDKHADFVMYPSFKVPQQWLKDRYGLDVFDDASVRKIHFMKKGIETRRARNLWNQVPVVHGEDAEIPLGGARPLADAFLDFTSGKSYARMPGLPDEDGFELVASWVEPEPEPSPPEEDTEGHSEAPGFPSHTPSPSSMITDE